MVRFLCGVLVVLSLGATSVAAAMAQSASPTADPFGPSAEECRVAPRSIDDLRTVGIMTTPSATPPVIPATPGASVDLGQVELPEGAPADAAVAGAVAETVRQMRACHRAGDMLRYLALFSDTEIRSRPVLTALATGLATGEIDPNEPFVFGQPTHFAGLFHTRVLADGRVAGIAPNDAWGLPTLYVFVRSGDRWLIDDIAPLAGPLAWGGIVDATFTGERRRSDPERGIGGYGFGIAWDATWQPLVETELGLEWVDLALTNGTSIVILGAPLVGAEPDLHACLPPFSGDPVADLERFQLNPAFFDPAYGLRPAVTAESLPVRGDDDERIIAVYDVWYRPGGGTTKAEPYRLFVECRAMAGGTWVLGITQLVPAAAYDAEVATREKLLASAAG